jgi:hypothetical protein
VGVWLAIRVALDDSVIGVEPLLLHPLATKAATAAPVRSFALKRKFIEHLHNFAKSVKYQRSFSPKMKKV